MLNKKVQLSEALQIEGATLIGTGLGYDVFDIHTWSAAQQFVVEGTEDPAGIAYTRSEGTFDSHINPDGLSLYFFAGENTNEVFGAMISEPADITIMGTRDNSITLRCSHAFENARHQNNTVYANRQLPLYLIPNISVTDCNNGIVVQDNTLKALLPELSMQNPLDVLDCRAFPHFSVDAFNYGLHINNLIIGENWASEQLGPDTASMFSNVSRISVALAEKPRNWQDGWNHGKENVTTFGYGLDPQTIINNAVNEINQILPESDEITSDAHVLTRIQTCKDIVSRLSGDVRDRFPQELIDTISQAEQLYDQRLLDTYVSRINITLPSDIAITADAKTADRIRQAKNIISTADARIRDRIPQELKDYVNHAEELYDQAVAEAERTKIKYQVIGNEITITGISPRAEEVSIPNMIDGKPVTKIAPYACYDRTALRRLSLPDTLREIGQGAFAECDNLSGRIRVPKDCLIGKNATLGSDLTLVN